MASKQGGNDNSQHMEIINEVEQGQKVCQYSHRAEVEEMNTKQQKIISKFSLFLCCHTRRKTRVRQ